MRRFQGRTEQSSSPLEARDRKIQGIKSDTEKCGRKSQKKKKAKQDNYKGEDGEQSKPINKTTHNRK